MHLWWVSTIGLYSERCSHTHLSKSKSHSHQQCPVYIWCTWEFLLCKLETDSWHLLGVVICSAVYTAVAAEQVQAYEFNTVFSIFSSFLFVCLVTHFSFICTYCASAGDTFCWIILSNIVLTCTYDKRKPVT